jgi:acyl carrier protein
VARWLVSCAGVERVVLASRRGPAAPGAAELAAELTGDGSAAAVEVVACDVTDREQVADLLASLGGLTAVIHAAGAVDDGVLTGLAPERVAGVIGAKAAGALLLDELTRDRDLAAFVVFSSFAGMVGSAGQGLYAAANAVTDAVVARRRAQGLAAVAVGWGPWAGAGMAGKDGIGARQQRGGLAPMDPAIAVQALGLVGAGTRAGSGGVVVADVDWERFGAGYHLSSRSRLLAEIPGATPPSAELEENAGAQAPLAAAVAQAPAEQRNALVLDAVCSLANAVLGHGSGTVVEPDRAFRDIGFDSLTAVEFGNVLAARTGLRFAGTTVFDYPTPQALADHVAGRLSGDADAGGAAAVLAELDRLEASILGISSDPDVHSALRTRLRVMLSKVDTAGGTSAPEDATQRIGTASDEELFRFIHDELGRS